MFVQAFFIVLTSFLLVRYRHQYHSPPFVNYQWCILHTIERTVDQTVWHAPIFLRKLHKNNFQTCPMPHTCHCSTIEPNNVSHTGDPTLHCTLICPRCSLAFFGYCWCKWSYVHKNNPLRMLPDDEQARVQWFVIWLMKARIRIDNGELEWMNSK